MSCEWSAIACESDTETTPEGVSSLLGLGNSGGEACQTSGGHLFWVSGEGWIKSRELRSGQILHSASGPVHISSVGMGNEAETYNLVVADFGTYFVGYRKVLSHDNTIRQPTRALVPGLKPE